jgi:hypothetical protein
MASGPWRCSQCGTVNEPVANSCRTCGKWPSLFDLEESVLDEGEAEQFGEPDETIAPETFEAKTFEPETFEQPPATPPPDVFETEPVEPAEPEAEESRGPRWVRAVIPIAVLVYFAISFFFNER